MGYHGASMHRIIPLTDDDHRERCFVWLETPPENPPGDNAPLLAELMLSEEECARAGRFYFRADYLAYVTAHALLRRALSHYGSLAPERWELETGRRGRPRIPEHQNPSGMSFSLSHTRTLVGCGVSFDGCIGVDIETIGRARDPLRLAQANFAPDEVDHIEAVSGRARDERFTAVWCLKEAYVKAIGLGISIPLDSFCFRPGSQLDSVIDFHSDHEDGDPPWRFWLFRPSETHFAAVALLEGGAEPQ